MVKTRLIPALLLKNGRLVKTTQFGETRDVGSPRTQAKIYDAQFADELILLDIDSTKQERNVFMEILHSVAAECFMPLTAGGGIRSVEDAAQFLMNGADKVALNTVVFEDPSVVTTLSKRYGRSTVTVSIDFRTVDGVRRVFTHNGTQTTNHTLLEAAKLAEELGAGELLINSIERDGMMNGYDLEAIGEVSKSVEIPVIASGGCGSVSDLVLAIERGASAVSAGSLFYFNDISVFKAHGHMRERGLSVRHITIGDHR